MCVCGYCKKIKGKNEKNNNTKQNKTKLTDCGRHWLNFWIPCNAVNGPKNFNTVTQNDYAIGYYDVMSYETVCQPSNHGFILSRCLRFLFFLVIFFFLNFLF